MSNEIVSRADAALMNIYGLQGIAETIYAFANDQIKDEYLPRFARGEVTGAIGRDREIASVRDLLMGEDNRIVTLTGPGGVGTGALACFDPILRPCSLPGPSGVAPSRPVPQRWRPAHAHKGYTGGGARRIGCFWQSNRLSASPAGCC